MTAQFRKQVKLAVECLGNGLLTPDLIARGQADEALRRALLDEVLRAVHGLIVLLTADAKGLLRPRHTNARAIAAGLADLKARAEPGHSSPHGKTRLWRQLMQTFRLAHQAWPGLGLFARVDRSFNPKLCADVATLSCTNASLLQAIRYLTHIEDSTPPRQVDYATLSVDELGGVQESLLCYAPCVGRSIKGVSNRTDAAPAFRLERQRLGRKTSGSYYTPPTLVAELIRSALGPVVCDRLNGARLRARLRDVPGEAPQSPLLDYGHLTPAQRRAGARALLAIRVCDPACGSAAFLVAANNYLAAELARIRTGRAAPPKHAIVRARRDVLWRCIYGVDVDPLTVELAKVCLWLNAGVANTRTEALAAHVKCGNSLLGAPPDVTDPPAVAIEREHRFFHWRLEFPEAFGDSAKRGFDCVLCNPPWEHIELKEREFFEARDRTIGMTRSGVARKRKIASLKRRDPDLYGMYLRAKRLMDEQVRFIRRSGRFPLTARGRINSYAVFAETCRDLINARGRAGLLVPSGIATDNHTRLFFGNVMERGALVSLYDLENAAGLFPNVHRSYKFCCLTLAGPETAAQAADFVFFARHVEDLARRDRHVNLSARDIARLNPNTRSCPIFRSRRDARITKRVYDRLPLLTLDDSQDASPWHVALRQGLFNVTSHSHRFRTRRQLEARGGTLRGNVFVVRGQRYLPLYEQNLIHQFDHRFATFAEADAAGRSGPVSDGQHRDPRFRPIPRFWVCQTDVDRATSGLPTHGRWLLVHRLNGRPTDQRTMISAIVPRAAVGNSLVIIMPRCGARLAACLCANLNSFVFDFITRQKVGGLNLNAFITKQLPVVSPRRLGQRCPFEACTWTEWISRRVVELSYTARDLRTFATDCGFDGPPFRWDPARRFSIRCELDAAFMLLYGITRPDAAYILDSFGITKRNDQLAHGDYRTKRVVLKLYDELITWLVRSDDDCYHAAAQPDSRRPREFQLSAGLCAVPQVEVD